MLMSIPKYMKYTNLCIPQMLLFFYLDSSIQILADFVPPILVAIIKSLFHKNIFICLLQRPAKEPQRISRTLGA
ncbi:calmodulin-binding transcription activator 1 isoform X1 [Iris pallida]|uniref:Calmodulin-binding transcription activator 1 isoform X1 n=1 Tax=Iris pallida TaxID=29817 RepID=A0AAX6F508_IRIPA|nr:calmodulin-binding transcription activator 1 isoform X1 [Iris pallida]